MFIRVIPRWYFYTFSLNGYKLIPADHPKNIKHAGVFIYDRETLPDKTIQVNYLPECLVCEVKYENKKISIVTLYWSPSQTDDECDEFLRSFESVINKINHFNPYFLLITGDFNARSNSWSENDTNNFEGFQNLTSSYCISCIGLY